MSKFKIWLNDLISCLKEGLRFYPIEIALLLVVFFVNILSYERIEWFSRITYPTIGLWSAMFVPLSYVLNVAFPSGKKRFLYYFLPLILFFIVLIFDPELKIFPSVVYITTAGLFVCAVFLVKGPYNDRAFVVNNLSLGVNLITALFLSLICLGFVSAIYESVLFLFNIDRDWADFYFYAVQAIFCVVFPFVLFTLLYMAESEKVSKAEFYSFPLLDSFANYILTPAVFIYLFFLYAYIVKILTQSELPKGGVVNMIFVFMIITAVAKSIYPFVFKQIFKFFYRYLGWFVLPPFILFVVAMMQRINDYGFTEWRLYLFLCGVLMTLYILSLFIQKLKYRCGIILYIGMFLFALVAYIPGLRPLNLSLKSQENRALELAEKLNVLNEDGMIECEPFALENDSLYKEMLSSLLYIKNKDSNRTKDLIVEDSILQNFEQPSKFLMKEPYIRFNLKNTIDVSAYSKCYCCVLEEVKEDTVFIYKDLENKTKNNPFITIPVEDLLKYIESTTKVSIADLLIRGGSTFVVDDFYVTGDYTIIFLQFGLKYNSLEYVEVMAVYE